MSRTNDESFEALLRKGLSGPPGDRGPDCPEPEILAAWKERRLSRPEAERWDRHFSVCPHCREEIAALARIPDGDGAEAGWWARFVSGIRAARWVTVGATAVIAIAIVIRIAPEGEVPQAPPTLRSADELGKQEAARPNEARSEIAHESSFDAYRRAPKAEPPAAGGHAGRESDRDLFPVAKSGSDELGEKKEDAPEAIEPRRRTAMKQVAPAPEGFRASNEREQESAAAGAATMADTAAPRQALVRAPRTSVLWRFGDGGLIERSVDGGSTWKLQSGDTDEDLLAASAPSDTVCWVVGRNGTILRTTDGIGWNLVEAPTIEDLTHVTAENGQVATITTITGRELVTGDGGQTWQPASPD